MRIHSIGALRSSRPVQASAFATAMITIRIVPSPAMMWNA